jgi:hypothetical protein
MLPFFRPTTGKKVLTEAFDENPGFIEWNTGGIDFIELMCVARHPVTCGQPGSDDFPDEYDLALRNESFQLNIV